MLAKTGHLDAKTRELIALAVAVTTRCDGCIIVHVDAALNAGAALVYSARVMNAVEVAADGSLATPSARREGIGDEVRSGRASEPAEGMGKG